MRHESLEQSVYALVREVQEGKDNGVLRHLVMLPIHPHTPEDSYGKAAEYEMLGDYGRARELFGKIAQSDESTSRFALAALARIDAVYGVKPSFEPETPLEFYLAHLANGLYHLQMKEYGKAISEYRAARALLPNNEDIPTGQPFITLKCKYDPTIWDADIKVSDVFKWLRERVVAGIMWAYAMQIAHEWEKAFGLMSTLKVVFETGKPKRLEPDAKVALDTAKLTSAMERVLSEALGTDKIPLEKHEYTPLVNPAIETKVECARAILVALTSPHDSGSAFLTAWGHIWLAHYFYTRKLLASLSVGNWPVEGDVGLIVADYFKEPAVYINTTHNLLSSWGFVGSTHYSPSFWLTQRTIEDYETFDPKAFKGVRII